MKKSEYNSVTLVNVARKVNQVQFPISLGVIAMMRKYDIRPSVNLIIGFPWETKSDYKDRMENMTSMPDETLDYYYHLISELRQKDTAYPVSGEYLEQIEKLH
ncbi:MAG TPA: hypothetical protein ENI77_04820 [Nitrospirae bacterium]|nr:hypothetical protein [Nitrospirota bacterium]